ncbi:MAG: hypothetical protein ACUVWJ_02235 [Spirochaetota bacterium]
MILPGLMVDEGTYNGKLTGETRFPENDWRSAYFRQQICVLKVTSILIYFIKDQVIFLFIFY